MATTETSKEQRSGPSIDLSSAADQLFRLIGREPDNAAALNQLAMVEWQRGHQEAAIEFIERAVEAKPASAEYRHRLGTMYAMLGRFDEATAALERTVQLDPNLADAHYNLANALKKVGRIDEAIEGYQRVVQLAPDYAEAHYNLANEFRDAGEVDRAIASFEAALKVRPGYPKAKANLCRLLIETAIELRENEQTAAAIEYLRRATALDDESASAWAHLGAILVIEGEHTEAIGANKRALELKSDLHVPHANLGTSYRECRQNEKAEEHFRIALRLKPDHAESHMNLASLLAKRRAYDEALSHSREALRIKPGFVEAIATEGSVLAFTNQMEDAIACFEEALRLRPDDPESLFNMALVYYQEGDYDTALARFDQALSFKPDNAVPRTARAMLLLARGQFEEGWREYEWRWKSSEFADDVFPHPRWAGESLEGKTILVRIEQGFGDSFQFIRYADVLKARGARVIYQCVKPLIPVISTCRGIDQVISREADLPEFDVYIPLMSIPWLVGTTTETVPADVPYLHPEPQLVEKWQAELSKYDGLKIGVAWHGNKTAEHGRSRSFPVAALEEIANLPGVTLFSLQRHDGLEELEEIRGKFEVVEFGDDFDTEAGPFMDTAAVMQSLDLVICCDSAVTHLAGAVGAETWVGLPQPAEWRWMVDRDDSLWYPKHRLFRQATDGDWDGVFGAMRDALVQRLAEMPASESKASVEGETPNSPSISPSPAAARAERQRQSAQHLKACVIHRNAGRHEEAVVEARKSLELDSESLKAHVLLAASLTELRRFAESVPYYRAAMAMRPESVGLQIDLGIALSEIGDGQGAIACYREAVELNPHFPAAHYNLALALLRAGEYTEGWNEYEWRLHSNLHLPWPEQPRWDNGPLDGKRILLRSEQGLGDTIQFVRYAKLAKAKGGYVIVQCQKALMPLLQNLDSIDELVPDGEDVESFDCYADLMSLPRITGTTLDAVPAEPSYIQPEETLVEKWESRLADLKGLRVGLAWQANPGQSTGPARSFQLAALTPLAQVPGVEFVSLQAKEGLDQLDSLPDGMRVMRLDDGRYEGGFDEQAGPFMDTAAVLKSLDLVIACDSAVGHLAGAIGVETWLALPQSCDWRWLTEREDSPWYPRHRLFRQEERGEWGPVFASIATALAERATAKSS